MCVCVCVCLCVCVFVCVCVVCVWVCVCVVCVWVCVCVLCVCYVCGVCVCYEKRSHAREETDWLPAHGLRPWAGSQFRDENPVSFFTGGTSWFYFTTLILRIPLFLILKWDYFLFFLLFLAGEPRRIHTHALYAPSYAPYARQTSFIDVLVQRHEICVKFWAI